MNKQVSNEVLFPEVARLLQEGKTVTLTPRGQSMLPFIRGGEDSVTLVRCEDIHVGDILLFQLPTGQYILHRLIQIEGKQLTFRGDGNIRGEEHCLQQDVIGKVIAITSKSGRTRKPGNAQLWQLLFPFRRILLKIYRHLPI